MINWKPIAVRVTPGTIIFMFSEYENSPNYDLEIAGDVHISGSLIDILGSPGVTGEVLAASPAGNIVWWDATTINTDEQNLSISGASDSLLISGGNGIPLSLIQDGVDDADNDPSNEFNTGFILNGNNLLLKS